MRRAFEIAIVTSHEAIPSQAQGRLYAVAE